MRLRAIGLVLGLAMACPGTSSAAPKTELDVAKELGTDGLKLYDAQQYEQALAKLNEADSHARVPTLDLFAARCLDKLHRLLDAKVRYDDVTRAILPIGSSQKWIDAQTDARNELAALNVRIPSVTVHASGLGGREASLTIDGHADAALDAEAEIDPGQHAIVVVVAGKAYKRDLDVKENEHPSVDIAIDPIVTKAPPPPPPAPKGPSGLTIAGAVTLSVGAAGLITWGATGGAALAKASAQHCKSGACTGSVGKLDALRTASTAAFYAGVPLTVLGTTLLVVSAATSHSTKTSVRAGLTNVSFDVSF